MFHNFINTSMPIWMNSLQEETYLILFFLLFSRYRMKVHFGVVFKGRTKSCISCSWTDVIAIITTGWCKSCNVHGQKQGVVMKMENIESQQFNFQTGLVVSVEGDVTSRFYTTFQPSYCLRVKWTSENYLTVLWSLI